MADGEQMLVPHTTDHTTTHDAVPKIVDMISDTLTGGVGLVFAHRLTAGPTVLPLAYLQRAAKRPSRSAEDFPMMERADPAPVGEAR
jgi:hypothetical protein